MMGSSYRKPLSHFFVWADRVKLSHKLAITLIVASIASGIATYISIAKNTNPFGPDPKDVVNLILINLVLLLSLATIITVKLIKLWLDKIRGSIGSRLQITIILMFSLMSVVPTIVITSFSVLFFNFGIQSWFNQRVSTALEESVAVADAYLSEHKNMIRADILAMSNDLSRESYLINTDIKKFNKIVNGQAALRSLDEAVVFRKYKNQNNVIARSSLSFSLIFELQDITPEIFEKANSGDVVIIKDKSDDRVRALIKIDNTFDTYLLVGRYVDSKIINHTERTKGSVNEYKRLKADISGLQIKFYMVFIGVAILILLAAIWFGMVIAGEFVGPISMLVKATEKVKAGDLKARVEGGPENDEIATLGKAFNLMTDQLEKQRNQLMEVNKQIEERRRFIEAVLLNVSAGVIVLDKNKALTIINRSAMQMLSMTSEKLYNENYTVFFPEIKELMQRAEALKEKITQGEVNFIRDKNKFIFLVRVAVQEQNNAIGSYIITFDNITEMKQAERNKAWSDVARRIAHEIKNPLTPIHLSAERLRKKYSNEVSTQPETFNKYIDTIISHVRDIGKMVEEFAEFARMPAPSFENNDICQIVKDAVFSQRNVNSNITYNLDIPNTPVIVYSDRRQVSQAAANILKNASEALNETSNDIKNKQIDIKVNFVDSECIISICDNGPGFPSDLIDRLTEPYVTTREKGTGLGLAIVKKIMDDHQGKLVFQNMQVGACVFLHFPARSAT